jgi:transposase
MRKILDVLRLSLEGGRSHREIARAINASPTTVGDLLRRAKLYGVTWPLPAGMSEPQLEAQLYPPAAPSNQTRPEPDWPILHRELRRKGVTLDLLWQEYKTEHPAGYRYSGFCALYRQWVGRLSLSLRQTHTPGEKLFVDYAGQTVPITDPTSGEIRLAAIFVAVLGASNYTYGEATWSQSLPDWIGSHARTFEHLGGVHSALGPRQPQERRHHRLLLRARTQPDLPRPGHSLRHGGSPRPAPSPERQGQGRGRRAAGRALGPGASAPPAFLQPGPSSTAASPN